MTTCGQMTSIIGVTIVTAKTKPEPVCTCLVVGGF